MDWGIFGVHLLELLKCCIGIWVAILFYKIVVSLDMIAGSYQGARRIKNNRWITMQGIAILSLSIFVALFFFGAMAIRLYDKKHLNYQEIWKWKGEIENRVNVLEELQ